MRRVLLAAGLTLSAYATPLSAAYYFGGTFSGSNEVPTNPSPGTGSVVISVNDARDSISFSASFTGLLSPTAASHIHCCTGFPGSNTGVAIDVPSLPGFPLGVTGGTFNATFDLLDVLTYNPAFVAANGGSAATARDALFNGLIAGGAYMNIHTSQFPGGEIRANLAPSIPEPGAWALLIVGFGVIGASMRRCVKIGRAASFA